METTLNPENPIDAIVDEVSAIMSEKHVGNKPKQNPQPDNQGYRKGNSVKVDLETMVEEFFKALPAVEVDNYGTIVEKEYKSKPELEVRFGIKGKPISVTDFDNVVRKLRSLDFGSPDTLAGGKYSLRINPDFTDQQGRIRASNVRVQINDLNNIQTYCRTNTLSDINGYSKEFQLKRPATKDEKNIQAIDVDNFNFKVSYADELLVGRDMIYGLSRNWKAYKKTFRYMRRITLTHPDYPFNIDLSIVKSSNRLPDKFGKVGKGNLKPEHNVVESNVFNNPPTYEIEVEVDNKKVGSHVEQFNTPEKVLASMRKVIKFILSGLQGTNYPVSYPEQREVIQDYMKMIWTGNENNEQYNPQKYVTSRNFIGPSSVTLQLQNIGVINQDSLVVNIRDSFVVTEKADGTRTLMYINGDGKIYLIDMLMRVMFTGAKTTNKANFNCLIDGELINKNKNGEYINLYAAFDIYFYDNKDTRTLTFMVPTDNKSGTKGRYKVLSDVVKTLDVVGVMGDKSLSPIRVTRKSFYPLKNGDIFDGCREILNKTFEYETDGLIFTHTQFSVGSDKIGGKVSNFKSTWRYSFKWKPPVYNTIDFLITTVKGPNGDDVVKPFYEQGVNGNAYTQFNQYKTIELRCGFNEYKNGFIDPCHDLLNDIVPKHEIDEKYKFDIQPRRFYPSDPFDKNAGLTNIMLMTTSTETSEMKTEENEVFTDNTIVEFSYKLDGKEGWKWVPLRVRHDKTAEYLQGNKQYGNSYDTANSNWKSIHFPVTGDMVTTGNNIPDVLVGEDVYYNTSGTSFMTQGLKNFHNLYVKRMLIKQVSRQGDTLIDFACGKGGDFAKWIEAKLSFVFGIDISKDNLENRLNGACARYLNAKKETIRVPDALFVNGNSAYNIKDGSAMLDDKAKLITNALFGIGTKDNLPPAVMRHFGEGTNGFKVSACQFAIHYFFENAIVLEGFLSNVAQCTKIGGYFIGTAYDGKEVFKQLKHYKTNTGMTITENNKKIWEIIKEYGSDEFMDDSSSIGYKISVFQESINQHFVEYLVNFDYLKRVFDSYGFQLLTPTESKALGLPASTGMFRDLYNQMINDISRNGNKYGKAPNMSPNEKKISFLNRYFVFKKVRNVETKDIHLDMTDYTLANNEKNERDTAEAIRVAEQNKNSQQLKLTKVGTLVLHQAEEVTLEQAQVQDKDKDKNKDKDKIKVKKTTKRSTVATDTLEEVVPVVGEEEPIIIQPERKSKPKKSRIKKPTNQLVFEDIED